MHMIYDRNACRETCTRLDVQFERRIKLQRESLLSPMNDERYNDVMAGAR